MDKREYRELCRLAANGGTKEFARLYECVYREMYYTAYYSLADDTDAIDVVTGAVKDGFAAVGRLHSEAAFRTFMMRSLCARIKQRHKEYAAQGTPVQFEPNLLRPNADGVDIKQEFNRLPDTERMIAAMYVAGRFLTEEIASYIGISVGAVKKKLRRSLEQLELD